MRRRDLISAAAAVLPAAAVASVASASDQPSSGGASVNISGVGLPLVIGGRLRNYVFVSMRLHLGGSATVESMRGKEAYLRDALVRAGHRTPFVIADDWTRIDTNAMSASLMRSASAICGRGSIARVEVISQAPRWRSGLRGG
ncbi:MAG: hypothetical protein EON85_05335 [Brevundimonas sp.]|nr:MAG: hypothetical protein EON85_05335 [Brevundimonas sp.]